MLHGGVGGEQALDPRRGRAEQPDRVTERELLRVVDEPLAAQAEKRRHRAVEELEALIQFAAGGVRAYAPDAKIGLGAMIDVSIETDDGSEERTLFMLPVGAGTELSGPGGDGFLSVIGPKSPVGMALMGACAGDEVEVIVAGRDREWSIVDVC